MIDSHCYPLDHEPLLSNLNEVIKIQRRRNKEVVNNINVSRKLLRIKEIIKKDEIIYGTIGIHPHETERNSISSEQIVKYFNENKKIIE